MPALEAFNMKWTIGSDDLVFPYILSIAMKLLWFIVTAVLVSINSEHHCNEESLLRGFVLILLSIQFISTLVQCTAVIISAKGTIANFAPRRHLRWVLYLQTVVFAVELVWECVGVVWAFDPELDCSSSHTILIVTRVVLIWNVSTSILMALYMFLRMGLNRFLCRRTPPWKLKNEEIPPSTSFEGRRLSRLSSRSLAHHLKRRRWQWLLQSVFCLSLHESQGNVFQQVSATLAEVFDKFRGYVVSDILAGVVLLEMKQKKEKILKEKPTLVVKKSSELSQKGTDNYIDVLEHYLRFAMGSYGWMLYVYSNGIRGLLQLSIASISSKCCHSEEPTGLQQTTVLGDNKFGWNTQAVLKWTDIRQMDLIHANFQRDAYCPAFIVAIDHVHRSVVVAIRGTLSVTDALIDLSAQPILLMTKDGTDFYAHQGISDTTHSLYLKLEGEGILLKIFKIYPAYRLILTGHSLGAGVAALLSIILQPVYPNLHCYAFSPPGGLVNLAAIPHTYSFITSVVLGHDLVPRLSLHNFESFSRDVLYQLKNSEIPKYRIFLSSFVQWLGLYRPSYRKTTLNHKPIISQKSSKQPLTIKRLDENDLDDTSDSFEDSFTDDEDEFESCIERNEEEEMEEEEEIEEEVEEEEIETKHFIQNDKHTTDPITGKRCLAKQKEKPFLYLPGHIIHLERGPLRKRCYCIDIKGEVLAHSSTYSDFSELIIDEEMISDHMPNVLLKAIQSLTDD